MSFELPDGYVLCHANLDGSAGGVRASLGTLQEAVDLLLEMHTVAPGENRYEERRCTHGIRLNFDPSEWRIVLYLDGEPNGEAWQVDCDGTANPL